MKWRLLIILLLTSSTGFATDKNAGTSAGQFLKIGAGARPTAMGNAFVGVADDVNAAYFNPAGLSNISRPEMTAMHTQWIQDLSYDFGAFVYPTNKGAFAVSACTLKVPDIPKRGADESDQGAFDEMDAAYGLSYARNLTPLLSVGITGRYIREELDSASASTWSGDIGLMKKPGRIPFSIGLAVRHLGQGLKFVEETDPLPMTVDLGVGVPLFNERLILSADVRKPRDNEMGGGAGAEWRQTVGKDFSAALRTGFSTESQDAPDASGMSFGAGLGYRQMQFDFAWVPFGDLGNTFRYAALIRF